MCQNAPGTKRTTIKTTRSAEIRDGFDVRLDLRLRVCSDEGGNRLRNMRGVRDIHVDKQRFGHCARTSWRAACSSASAARSDPCAVCWDIQTRPSWGIRFRRCSQSPEPNERLPLERKKPYRKKLELLHTFVYSRTGGRMISKWRIAMQKQSDSHNKNNSMKLAALLKMSLLHLYINAHHQYRCE